MFLFAVTQRKCKDYEASSSETELGFLAWPCHEVVLWTCTCHLSFENTDDNKSQISFLFQKTFKVITKIDVWEVFKNKKKNLSKVFTIMK